MHLNYNINLKNRLGDTADQATMIIIIIIIIIMVSSYIAHIQCSFMYHINPLFGAYSIRDSVDRQYILTCFDVLSI